MASLAELIHGRKPEIAPFKPTDPLKELYNLLTGEVKDWPQITQLSDLYQTYMTGAFNKAIPGFSDILAQGGKDTEAVLQEAEPLIHGELPPDVKAQVMRSAAYRSLGAGTLFGPMAGALTARDLGRTSLDLMSQGAGLLGEGGNAAQRWQGIAQGLMLPPSNQLYSPQWFSTFEAQQRAAQQATKQLKFNVEAAPDPVVSGIAGTIMNLVGAYMGAGKGGGGGGIIPSYSSSMGNTALNYSPSYAGANVEPGQTGMGQQLWNMLSGQSAATNVGGPGYGGYSAGVGANPAHAMSLYNPAMNYGGMPTSSLDYSGFPQY